MKLTEPQWMLLREVAAAKKLAEFGLCQWNNGSYGQTWLSLTEAGRSALKQEGESAAHDGEKQ